MTESEEIPQTEYQIFADAVTELVRVVWAEHPLFVLGRWLAVKVAGLLEWARALRE